IASWAQRATAAMCAEQERLQAENAKLRAELKALQAPPKHITDAQFKDLLRHEIQVSSRPRWTSSRVWHLAQELGVRRTRTQCRHVLRDFADEGFLVRFEDGNAWYEPNSTWGDA
ncbi:hypothetical protein, partial [Escherichia coli]|uniref:hypothetical protein n=2 Tax=Bacteria TaxID=2 RepID=UPI003B9E19BD